MVWPIIAAIGGAAIGARASRSAAQTQAESADAATRLQQQMFERQTELNEPWRQAGINALARMQSGDIGLTRDPSYAFRFSEGMKALERARAAGGRMFSGGTERAAIGFGQDLASTEYGNAFNRLASLAGLGQTATGNMSGQAGQFGTNVGNMMMGAGNARASGYVGQANALTSALGQGLQQYQFNQLMNRFPMQAPAAGGGFYGGGMGGGAPAYGSPYEQFRYPEYT
jgi:hypothetical protein